MLGQSAIAEHSVRLSNRNNIIHLCKNIPQYSHALRGAGRYTPEVKKKYIYIYIFKINIEKL